MGNTPRHDHFVRFVLKEDLLLFERHYFFFDFINTTTSSVLSLSFV